MRENIVINRIKSLRYAYIGFRYLLKTENAIKTHILSTILLTIVGFTVDLSLVEWMFQFLAIGLVISIEALNTCVEKIADYIQPNYDLKIGKIKDMGAGAVLFAAIFGMIILCLIYIPKFINYFI